MNDMELDIRLAKEFMGWTYVPEQRGWVDRLGDCRWSLYDYGQFQPTSDCRSTWELVEEAHNRGFYFSLAYARGTDNVSVMFYREGVIGNTSTRPITWVGRGMPMTVSKAVLRLLETEADKK